MLGYTEATIARKAEKRGISIDEYKAILVTKRQTRSSRRRAAKVERTNYLLSISTWTEQERKAQGLI